MQEAYHETREGKRRMSTELSRQSERWLRVLVEHTTDSIALVTLDGTITYAGPSTERVTGYSAEEVVGRNSFEFVHPEDLEYTRQQFTSTLDRPGNSATIEFRYHHKNETWRWMEGTLTNLLDDPAVGAVVCNYRDIMERKQAEEERKRLLAREQAARAEAEAAQARLYDLFKQAPAAMAILRGPEHRFAFASPLFLPNKDRADLVGKTVRETLPELVEQGVLAILDEVYTTGTPFVGTEFPARVDRGGNGVLQEAYFNVVNQPLRTAQGDIDGILIHSVEVTEQVQARRRLEELNRQLEAEKDALHQAEQEAQAKAGELTATFEAMTDGVVVSDSEGRAKHTNAAFRAFFSLPADPDPELLLSHKRNEGAIPRDLEGRPLPRDQWAISRVLRGERLSDTNTMDLMCHTTGEQDMYFNASGAPIHDAAGQIVGGVVVFRDVTERYRLEQQLQYSERKLRMLVESNIFGMAVTDGAGRIYEVNDRYAQVVGYSKDELLSETFSWHQLVPPDSLEALAHMEETLLSTGALPPQERESLHKDGRHVPILIAGALFDKERDLALTVILDISEQKEAERRKQEFLSMVSHELRTPLQSIMGFIELALLYGELLPESLSPEAKDLIGKIETVLKQALGRVHIEARLVGELLDVSRLEMHKFELSLQREDLVTIVRETVANQQAVRTRHIELVLPPDEVVPVIADAGRIGQVLTDYLTNALKYAPVDQAVAVHLEVTGIVARVSVRDQGPGLTPREQQRVWERFYQVAVPRHQEPDGGLGLGLAIARAIIEQHHGQVGVESAPGHGATFWFTLPIAVSPARS